MRVGIGKIANSPYEIGHFHLSSSFAHMQISQVTSLLVEEKSVSWPGGQYGEFSIFQIFGLKLLSAFSRLDNKRGGIL